MNYIEYCVDDGSNVKSTYRERLVKLVKVLGQMLIDDAENIIPNNTNMLSELKIESDISHTDSIPSLKVHLDYAIRGSREILETR